MERFKTAIHYRCLHVIILIAMTLAVGHGAPVSPDEAVAIADLWYSMELNSGYLKIAEEEKIERFAQMGNHEVHYMVADDELLDVCPADRSVLAYIVAYFPSGFVVISGDDRIKPVLVHSIDSKFLWDEPERNFLRFYLEKVVPALWSNMSMRTHENWSLLRRKRVEDRDLVTFDDIGRAVYVLWHTAPWDQGGFYNDTCEAHNGGNNVPVGCTATAMAIKMKFHSWPLNGNDWHAYNDVWGSIQFSHNVTFSSQSYDWGSMPDTFVTEPNSNVARIGYHAGVSVDMNYEIGASGAWPTPASMNTYFRYRGTIECTEDHEPPIQESVIGKLPVVISSTKHTVLVTGYRDNVAPYYYFNCGWSGAGNGWYSLDNIPGGDPTIDCSYPYSQPNSWVYVDKNHGAPEEGTLANPYNTLVEGRNALSPGGALLIKTGTYNGSGNVPITFTIRTVICGYAGDVVIGENVGLMYDGAIKLHNYGEFKITP
jgi:hypothetical protein